MKLISLLEEIEQALEREGSTANEHTVLAQKISDLADMVGWAPGPIDPQNKLADRLATLMASLRSRHERTGEESIAALHDCVAGLQETIHQHDRDLSTARDADEDDEY